MPKESELRDLCNNCDWTWTMTNGVNGYVVRGRGDYSSASIFLPAAGHGIETSLKDVGSSVHCWSSVPYSVNGQSGGLYSWALSFPSSDLYVNGYRRYCGMSVRPLQGFIQSRTNVSASNSLAGR